MGGVGRHPMPEFFRKKEKKGQGKNQNDRETGGDGFQDAPHEDGPVGIKSMVKERPEKGSGAEGEANGKGEEVGEGELGMVGGQAPGKGGDQANHADGGKKDGKHAEFFHAKFLGGGKWAVRRAHGLPALAKSGGSRLAGAFWESWRARR